MKTFSLLCFVSLLSSSEGSSKIIEYPDRLEFTREGDSSLSKESQEDTSHFLSFKKIDVSFPYEKACKVSAPAYQIEGGKTYMSLYNFIELSQRTDFKVSPHREYAVVWSTSCQRPCAGAEMDWDCKLNATLLNDKGKVLGDMGGNFEEALFHNHLPYVFLVRRGAGDGRQYAEIYDLKGNRVGQIEDFDHAYDNSFLDRPIEVEQKKASVRSL